MGPETIIDKLRGWIGALGWHLFIWSYAGTEEDYFEEIYRQERDRIRSANTAAFCDLIDELRAPRVAP